MRYIEAPNTTGPDVAMKVFLAGGITGCPDWQSDVVRYLEDVDVTVFNPRREDFPIGDPNAAMDQIKWEHDHLRKADAILFWFPCETLCPIVLYELGAWSMTTKPLIIGCHPDYKRIQDVNIQTMLARPRTLVHRGLDNLKDAIRGYCLGKYELD